MYKPPENANRVKAIKSKFERLPNDAKTATRPLLRKSKTLQEFQVKSSNGTSSVTLPKAELKRSPPIVSERSDKVSLSQSTLTRQASDPSKRNIKRSPAFRLDRNVIIDKTGGCRVNSKRREDNKALKPDYNVSASSVANKEKIGKTTSDFLSIREKFNEGSKFKNGTSEKKSSRILDTEPKLTDIKFLYSEPLPKSQRIKNQLEDDDIHTSDTLKLTDVVNEALVSSIQSTELRSDELKAKDASTNKPDEVAHLSNTLKNALKKPLPKGPAPKKPPRTFLHSPESKTDKTINVNETLINKLEFHNAKKGDPKYMLDKLESILKTKGVLKKNEESKIKVSLRDLPETPTASSRSLPVYYSNPPTSPKFNFNCLTSLCVTAAYEPVKEPSSSFFVSTKREEPVYAEPFEYQEIEEVKSDPNKDSAISGVDVPNNAKTESRVIRRSVHYASSPVPDVKPEETNGNVMDATNQDQGSSETSSGCTSDMDSSLSTPSEEGRTLLSGIKVKDLVKAIENSSVRKSRTMSSARDFHKDSDEDRVKKLEMQLKKTLDRTFSSSNTESSALESDANEEDGESKRDEVKFETYVKRVRSKIFCRSRRKKDYLFHCCLLVALNRSTPYVKSKFPLNVDEPHKIADLCFPEVENGPMDTNVKAQCYSLIITNELGERTFGYCRRVLPEGSTECLPLAYCILSKHRAPGFYQRVLQELEYRHGYPDMFRQALLEELYNCKFPQPGETIVVDCARIAMEVECNRAISGDSANKTFVRCCDNRKRESKDEISEDSELDLKSYVIVCNNGEYGTLVRGKAGGVNGSPRTNISCAPNKAPPAHLMKRCNSSPSLPVDLELLPSELVFIRPQDARHEENDLTLLGDTVKMPVLQQIFCSLLLERKVILISCILSKLSSCIEALQIILYPFAWQHTIIPVLPRSLWEIVDTPTPLVCGVLSPEVVNNYVIEHAIVVDLDAGLVLQQVGDEERILPTCLIQTLKDGLSLASKVTSNHGGTHNVFLSDAFLRVFIQSCGHYRDHILGGKFQKSDFIQSGKQKGKRIKPFLKWFAETTMFENFVDEVQNDSHNLNLFDQRIKIYSSDSATEVLNKMKYWTNYIKV